MEKIKGIYQSISIFIFSILALGASLFLYIYWYLEVSTGLARVVERYGLDSSEFFEVRTWVVILVLSILVGIILVGIFIIFIYNQKAFRLYRVQRNFISGFTHELKTPATSLKLYLETFAKHDLPREEQLRYIEFMIRDVDRLVGNINGILSLTRLQARSYRKEFVEMDIVGGVEEFCRDHVSLFRNGDIRVDVPAGGPYVCMLHPALFGMLLMNILTNAVKYSGANKPEVRIRFEHASKHIRMIVADNGIGIEKTELKRIFRKFYQVGDADNMTARGSGLGLYLVQNIARIHRGKIKAESEGPGKGSSFTLTLPLAAGHEKMPAERREGLIAHG
jgi:signal transduction histidine kinase